MKNKKKGFSLIEVVMALAVISIGVLPILSMYPSALKMTVKATENEEWSRVTMSILDYVKSRGYDGLNHVTWNTSGSSITIERSYNFVKSENRYISSTSGAVSFDSEILNVPINNDPLFIINSKGIKLNDYKFSIYMEKVQPQTTSGGSVEVYRKYDLINNKIVSTTTSSSIIYGIIKIRKSGESFSDERTRDMKFIITPIENWGN